MKIVFFGRYGSFDYSNIGGTNSLIRRLAKELISKLDVQADYVLYGAPNQIDIIHKFGIRSRQYISFDNALHALDEYDHIITIYISLINVFGFLKYYFSNRKSKRFHTIFQSWPESFLKRKLFFLTLRLFCLNGIPFVLSPRLLNYARKFNSQATLLWPPVTDNYFIRLDNKNISDKIRVTFVGRIDKGKGIIETIKLFNDLADRDEVELNLYGTYWTKDPDAVKLHRALSAQKRFRYTEFNFRAYCDEVDDEICSILRDTDIFIQPYRILSSTIDTPLLILEAMASLCAIVTKPYGDIPYVYGKSKTLFDDINSNKEIINLILSAKDWLPSERKRVFERLKALDFKSESVAHEFIDKMANR